MKWTQTIGSKRARKTILFGFHPLYYNKRRKAELEIQAASVKQNWCSDALALKTVIATLKNGWSIINNFRGYKCFSFTTSEAAGKFIFFLNWIAYVEELKICPCLGIFLLCSPRILLSSTSGLFFFLESAFCRVLQTTTSRLIYSKQVRSSQADCCIDEYKGNIKDRS